MQLIVLGMHRSGTSAVTRLLNMMGSYVGPEESLLEANTDDVDALWDQNRKGFEIASRFSEPFATLNLQNLVCKTHQSFQRWCDTAFIHVQ